MQEKFLYLIILLFFEIYEASWQKSETFLGIIDNIQKKFKNGQIYFQLPDGTITQEMPKEYKK